MSVVPATPSPEKLASRRHVTLILRLVIDWRGRLVHGEAVDAGGARPAHFVGAGGLTRAVRLWLRRQAAHQEDDRSADGAAPPR